MPGRGASYTWERITMTDPETGVEVTQLASAPVPSMVLYFENPSFTADNRTLLFVSQRVAMRGAPWDLYRVDEDGTNLAQLSDEAHPFGSPVPAPDQPRLVYGVRDNALLALDMDTFEEAEIARCEEATGLGAGTLTGDGRYYLACGSLRADGKPAIVRFRTDGSETAVLCHGYPRNHLAASHDGRLLYFAGWWESEVRLLVCDIHGEDVRPLPFQRFAHNTWLGRENRIQGTLLPPGHAIGVVGPDEAELTRICAGPYFWHSAASADGEWIVSDTNWPDIGILLVHAPTGRYAPLVKPKSFIGHPQETHPHPSFNRDGTKVVFTSNQTGLSQVYLCPIPDFLRQELLTGRLSNRMRKWR